MAEKFVIKAEKRETRGKNEARRMRVAGKVPVIVYGGGGESVSVTAELADLAAILRSETGHNTLFTLSVAGEGDQDVIFQDRQIDGVTGRLIHADLRRLVKGEKIEMTVPVHLVGDPIGVKEEGGMLEQVLRELKILAEPANAPESIEADVTELKVGDSLHVSDLKVAAGIEVHDDAEAVIAHVVIPKEPELEPQIGEPEAEAAPADTAETEE